MRVKKNGLAKSGKIGLNKPIALVANTFGNNSYMFVSRNFALFDQTIFFNKGAYFFHKLSPENQSCSYLNFMGDGTIEMLKTAYRCVRNIPRIQLVPHLYELSCHKKQPGSIKVEFL